MNTVNKRTMILSAIIALFLAPVAASNDTPRGGGHTSVTVCHIMGHGGYKLLTMDDDALQAHIDHGDLYPVPEGGCPGTLEETPDPTVIVATPDLTTPPQEAPGSTETPGETPTLVQTPPGAPQPPQAAPVVHPGNHLAPVTSPADPSMDAPGGRVTRLPDTGAGSPRVEPVDLVMAAAAGSLVAAAGALEIRRRVR